MDWPPANLQGYVNILRGKIESDRWLYSKYRKWLAERNTPVWEAVGELIKTRAKYHRGEILRAKRDTQRFALGEDPQAPNQYGATLCGWTDRYLRELPAQITAIVEDQKMLESAVTESEAELYTVNLELAERLLTSTINNIVTLTKDFERTMYGG